MTHQGPETYENQTVRLCDLVRDRLLLEGITFVNCRIVGLAVLVPFGDMTFEGTTFGAETEMEDVLWEVPSSRVALIGAIPMTNCRLISCKTTNVGFAGQRPFIEKFRQAMTRRDD